MNQFKTFKEASNYIAKEVDFRAYQALAISAIELSDDEMDKLFDKAVEEFQLEPRPTSMSRDAALFLSSLMLEKHQPIKSAFVAVLTVQFFRELVPPPSPEFQKRMEAIKASIV